VTTANYPGVGANAYAASSAMLAGPMQVTSVLNGVSVDSAGFNLPRSVVDLLMFAVEEPSRLATGITQSRSCPGGGSMRIDANLQNSRQVSAGDSIVLVASNCLTQQTNFNGKISIQVRSASMPASASDPLSLNLGVNLENLSAAKSTGLMTMNGDMQLAFQSGGSAGLGMDISGNTLVISETLANQTTAQRTLTGYSASMKSTGLSTQRSFSGRLSGQSPAVGSFNVDLKTLQPFVFDGASADPKSGAIQALGAGSAVTITAVDATSVRLDYSAKADAAVNDTVTLSWSELNKRL
jgi:hypothetical protein